jgi:two-component system LytT family response regulator
MQLKCVAIDDEPLALTLIKTYVSRVPALSLVQTFDDAISGIEFLRHNPVDLLFVDINMPDITGIDLVRALEHKPMVIFITAHKNFAFEGFELEAIDYVLKPVDFSRFSKAVDKAIDYYQYKHAVKTASPEESLYVYSEYRMVKINLADIEYIESMEDYIKIHLPQGKPILTLMPLKRVLEKLPADQFKRIHRSYIVAVNKIRSIQNRKVYLNDIQLPISDSYTDFIKEWSKQ